jgi:hypothetical protein
MNTEDIKYSNEKMIYWNTSNKAGDRYEVWHGGHVIARHITFNECWALVENLQCKATATV